jgi:hypothetical protein
VGIAAPPLGASDPLFDASMAAAWSQAGRLLLVWDGASGRCQSSEGTASSLKLLLLSGGVGRCQWSGEFMRPVCRVKCVQPRRVSGLQLLQLGG